MYKDKRFSRQQEKYTFALFLFPRPFNVLLPDYRTVYLC